ncbi:hypothetical protein [Methylocystis sp. B8]|nr:hypothetical protein [Methylocystis sp. B8]
MAQIAMGFSQALTMAVRVGLAALVLIFNHLIGFNSNPADEDKLPIRK